ncbi:MAG: N-acetylmuramidase domain-containing protein [Gemmatimonadales bacterium]
MSQPTTDALQFAGSGRPLSTAGFAAVCDDLGVGAPEIWAVLSVETGGFGFLADRRPQILFERHVFHRLTQGRFDATHPDISNTNPGGYAGRGAEYGRLELAVGLDRGAALQSASWGIGQIMGFTFAGAGFGSIGEMVDTMVGGEDAQLMAMGRLIADQGWGESLRRRDWAAFARGYNGEAYALNAYDTRLAAAYAGYRVARPDLSLRAAQAGLLFLGIDPGPVDGMLGRRTRGAVMVFQERNRLPITGNPDPETAEEIMASAFGAWSG